METRTKNTPFMDQHGNAVRRCSPKTAIVLAEILTETYMRHSAFILLLCLGCGSVSAMTTGASPVDLTKNDVCADKGTAPCVQTWDHMSADDRAEIWPYLDEVSRAMHWRSMGQAERNELREHLSVNERERLRQRFCSQQVQKAANHETRKLRREERMLLRKQIKEFHVQRVGSHAYSGGTHTAESTPVR